MNRMGLLFVFVMLVEDVPANHPAYGATYKDIRREMLPGEYACEADACRQPVRGDLRQGPGVLLCNDGG